VPALPPADKDDADDLLELLHTHRELKHLRVRHRGPVLTIESGAKTDPASHARLRRATKQLWTLEIATHMGTWQHTGQRGPMRELVGMLLQQFPWVLAPVG
jgi:hypothetical protein